MLITSRPSLVVTKPFHKPLGLILDSKLTFIEHVNDKFKTAKRYIGILKFLSNYLPIKTLDQVYKMYVRPHLDYGDVIYHIPQSQSIFNYSISLHPLMERIEQVQYQAALAITGCWRGSNRNKIYDELGWESLSDRRWSRRMVQLFKIRNDMTPQYLKNNLPPIQSGSLRYNNVTKYREISCNTARYMNSFFPDAIRSWNSVGVDFCSTLSIAVFKKNVTNLIRPKPRPIFGISDSMGIKFIC